MAYNTTGQYAANFRNGVYNTGKSNIWAVGVTSEGSHPPVVMVVRGITPETFLETETFVCPLWQLLKT